MRSRTTPARFTIDAHNAVAPARTDDSVQITAYSSPAAAMPATYGTAGPSNNVRPPFNDAFVISAKRGEV